MGRVISAEERGKVSNILNSKYGLSDGGGFAYVKVDTSKPATHSIKYSVLDKSGNLSEVVRTIIVSGDENKPFIVMNGDVSKTIEAGSIDNYTDPGAVGKSSDGTTLKDDLTGVGDIELLTPGTYTLSYNFSDAGGNAADTAVRTIRVVDTVGPVVTLTGDEPMKLFVDAPFQDPGATSVDQRDGEFVTDVGADEWAGEVGAVGQRAGAGAAQVEDRGFRGECRRDRASGVRPRGLDGVDVGLPGG